MNTITVICADRFEQGHGFSDDVPVDWAQTTLSHMQTHGLDFHPVDYPGHAHPGEYGPLGWMGITVSREELQRALAPILLNKTCAEVWFTEMFNHIQSEPWPDMTISPDVATAVCALPIRDTPARSIAQVARIHTGDYTAKWIIEEAKRLM